MDPTQAYYRERSPQTIDAEIKSLEESIRVLKHRRNALSPISSLPAEVFAAILSFLCLPGIPSLGGTPHNNLARIRISHVCHRWREIALNQPLLWSHFDFDTLSLASVTEMLVRTKSVPLYFEARISLRRRYDVARFSTFQAELQAHIPRICHLSITAESLVLLNILGGLVSPAPTLEHLSLNARGNYRSEIRRMLDKVFIPDTLFDGCTPRLSYLKLRNYNISWKSPLLRGLKYLKILTPSDSARPNLAVWLDALDEMRQLKTLTLYWASPLAPPFPFDVKRTIVLPSLTHLAITSNAGDCALALAHLNLPALTWLCLGSYIPNRSDLQNLLLYVARHVHGLQDIQPLQSMLIRDDGRCLDILAWPVPDFDVEAYDTPALLGATLPTRMVLALRSNDPHSQVLDMVMTALPLDGLVTLTAQNLNIPESSAPDQQFWLRHSPKWPLLRRVILAPPLVHGFIEMLLEDNGGREEPLLPSLTELVLVYASVHQLLSLPLCDALMKRVEQGVPLDILDLRTCHDHHLDNPAVQLFSEIVVDVRVLDLDISLEAKARMRSMWGPLASGPFIGDEEILSDTDDEY